MITPNSGIASFLAPDRSKLTVPVLPVYGSLAGGLDVTDVAFAGLFSDGLEALVCEGDALLRFPVRPLKGSGAKAPAARGPFLV